MSFFSLVSRSQNMLTEREKEASSLKIQMRECGIKKKRNLDRERKSFVFDRAVNPVGNDIAVKPGRFHLEIIVIKSIMKVISVPLVCFLTFSLSCASPIVLNDPNVLEEADLIQSRDCVHKYPLVSDEHPRWVWYSWMKCINVDN